VKSKPTVVIDTNLFISAIIKGGTPFELLKQWQNNEFLLVTTQRIFEEIAEVFRRDVIFHKYQLNQAEIQQLLSSLRLNAKFVTPLNIKELPVHSRDLKDDKILAAALSGEVNFLISGDEDLLSLNDDPNLGNLKILTAREFLKRLVQN